MSGRRAAACGRAATQESAVRGGLDLAQPRILSIEPQPFFHVLYSRSSAMAWEAKSCDGPVISSTNTTAEASRPR